MFVRYITNRNTHRDTNTISNTNEIQLNIAQFSQYRTKLNGEEDHCKVGDIPYGHLTIQVTSTKYIAGQS